MRFNLSKSHYLQPCNEFNTAITDGDFPASGSYIDVSKFTHIAFLIMAGTLDSALTCKIQEVTAVDGTPADVDATYCTVTVAADADNKLHVLELEVAKITGPYVTLDVAGAAGSNDYLSIIFVGWNANELPVTQPSSVVTPVLHVG